MDAFNFCTLKIVTDRAYRFGQNELDSVFNFAVATSMQTTHLHICGVPLLIPHFAQSSGWATKTLVDKRSRTSSLGNSLTATVRLQWYFICRPSPRVAVLSKDVHSRGKIISRLYVVNVMLSYYYQPRPSSEDSRLSSAGSDHFHNHHRPDHAHRLPRYAPAVGV